MVELESDSDPPPPVIPYVPSGNDLGPSAALTDAPLDMIDPFSGGEAGPEESSRHSGVDISSISYAGLVDGRATFKVTMVGEGKSLFDSGPPRWDISIRVTTPDGTEYNLFVSNNNGELRAFAGDGVNDTSSNADIKLEWSDDGHTACLSAAGVDLPPGSSVSVFAATSRDAESSGFYDEVIGTLVGADPPTATDDTDPGTATDTKDDGVDTAEETPSDTPSTSTNNTDSGGGFPVAPVAGGVGAAILGGLFWRWLRTKDEVDGVSAPTGGTALAAAPPDPSTADILDDTYLRHLSAEDAQWELSDSQFAQWQSLQDAEATESWGQYAAREAELQARLESLVTDNMNELSEGIAEFAESAGAYSEAIRAIIEGSDEITSLYNEWAKAGGVKDIMWWADLADAVAGLSMLVKGLATGASKLIVKAAGLTDEVADGVKVIDEVVEGIDEAAAAAEAAKPSFLQASEAQKIYTAEGTLENFGYWLDDFVGYKVTDWGAGLFDAAGRMGYYLDFTHAERVVLNTLATKARLAAKNAGVVVDPEDLAWLWRAGQDPKFWENLRNAAALDGDARVYKILDDVEISLLQQLANSTEAADAARAFPGSSAAGAAEAADSAGTVILQGGAALPAGDNVGTVILSGAGASPPPTGAIPFPTLTPPISTAGATPSGLSSTLQQIGANLDPGGVTNAISKGVQGGAPTGATADLALDLGLNGGS